jgi:molybdopterin synthase catalytic subunit
VLLLTAEPIDLAALIAAVGDDAHGAICTFLGTTRETSPGDPRAVEALDYEAYAEMALADFRTIADEAQARFGPLKIAIVHRTGRVPLGEASVAVAVGTPHRGASFDACEFAIDTLKARTPIWKKERYRDGGGAWVANAEAGK